MTAITLWQAAKVEIPDMILNAIGLATIVMMIAIAVRVIRMMFP